MSRKDEIKKRTEEIAAEKQKHQKSIETCRAQRKELQLEFGGVKEQRKKEVDRLLEKNLSHRR